MAVAEAGGVVVRRDRSGERFLLVTAKKQPSQWVFPKGHVEDGESAADAARREVAEEAGVVGHVVAPLDDVTFTVGAKALRVQFFLLEYDGEVEPQDRRHLQWLTYDEATLVLTFAEARQVLRSAWTVLHPEAPPVGPS